MRKDRKILIPALLGLCLNLIFASAAMPQTATDYFSYQDKQSVPLLQSILKQYGFMLGQGQGNEDGSNNPQYTYGMAELANYMSAFIIRLFGEEGNMIARASERFKAEIGRATPQEYTSDEFYLFTKAWNWDKPKSVTREVNASGQEVLPLMLGPDEFATRLGIPLPAKKVNLSVWFKNEVARSERKKSSVRGTRWDSL